VATAPPPVLEPDESDESLEWLALLEELDLPLATIGLRVRFWQQPPGRLTTETAMLQQGRVGVTDRFSVPLATVGDELGAFVVAVYLVRAEALSGPLAPPPWALTAASPPTPMRWVRMTVRPGDSRVAIEARWRAVGEERIRIVGLTATTPKRAIDAAWAGFPLLWDYQGISRGEQAFRERVRVGLDELAKRSSNFEHGLTISAIAKASGFTRSYFSSCLTKYGIDRDLLTAWRPGLPMPL
jgi:hypothetical protein